MVVNDGIYDWSFKFVSGGFYLPVTPISYFGLIFPTLQRETTIRLAHKGLLPIKSNHGYIYFVDKEEKFIGTTSVDEYTQTLIDSPVKNNRNLRKNERAELKGFNLL